VVLGTYCLQMLEHWDGGFKFPLETWMCAHVFLCCVVLYVGRCLVSGWSPIQGALPNVHKFINLKKKLKILSQNRPWGVILVDYDNLYPILGWWYCVGVGCTADVLKIFTASIFTVEWLPPNVLWSLIVQVHKAGQTALFQTDRHWRVREKNSRPLKSSFGEVGG
jgi:hypothetical protein